MELKGGWRDGGMIFCWMVFDTCPPKKKLDDRRPQREVSTTQHSMNTSTKDFSIYYRNLGRPCEPNIDPFGLCRWKPTISSPQQMLLQLVSQQSLDLQLRHAPRKP